MEWIICKYLNGLKYYVANKLNKQTNTTQQNRQYTLKDNMQIQMGNNNNNTHTHTHTLDTKLNTVTSTNCDSATDTLAILTLI